MVILGYRVGPLAKRVGAEIIDDSILGLAAQTAYYFFFSLFPFLLFAAPILSLVGDRAKVFNALFGQLARALPPDAWKPVEDVLKDVVFSDAAPGLISIGALLAAWAGSNIFSALMDALNRAYDVSETRPWWKRKLIAIAAVPLAGLVLLTATLVMLAGEDIALWIAANIGGGGSGVMLWTVIQYPLVFMLLVGLSWTLFYCLPNVRQEKTHTLAGAVTTTILWALATLVFRLYVQAFGSYNKTYGTIGGVIILLTWMYLSMLVVLIGGELASELHHGTGAVKPRSGVTLAGRITTAPPLASTAQIEPMNARPAE